MRELLINIYNRIYWRTHKAIVRFYWFNPIVDLYYDSILKVKTREVSAFNDVTHCSCPTPYLLLKKIFRHIHIDNKTNLVDIGCGTGRTLFYLAAKKKLTNLTGIELDTDIYKQLQANISSSHYTHEIVTYCIDARQYDYTRHNIIYLANPFSVKLLDEVMGTIKHNIELNPRPITIIYYYSWNVAGKQYMDSVVWLKGKQLLKDCTIYTN